MKAEQFDEQKMSNGSTYRDRLGAIGVTTAGPVRCAVTVREIGIAFGGTAVET